MARRRTRQTSLGIAEPGARLLMDGRPEHQAKAQRGTPHVPTGIRSTNPRRRMPRLDELAALASTLATSVGPLAGQKLLLTATRKAVLTSSGGTILSVLPGDGVLEGLVLATASKLVKEVGDGSKTFVVMLAGALEEIDRQLLRLPTEERRRAWRVRLAMATRWLAHDVLSQVLIPRWQCQAVQTDAYNGSALRADALNVASTALGGHFGPVASSALASALVEALVPDRGGHGDRWSPVDERPAIAIARVRARGDCSLLVVAAGGAPPERSYALDGRMVEGTPTSEAMPTEGHNVSMVVFGAHAAPPEAEAAGEAPSDRNSLPAELEIRVHTTASPSLGTASVGEAAACAWDAALAARERWVLALRAGGVRLLLSATRIGTLTSQLCAQHGICAIAGVDCDDLRALCADAGIAPLQRWPHPNLVGDLMARSAGFVGDGIDFESKRLGGRRHIHVRLRHSATLATLVVRGASDGLAREYATAVSRVRCCMRLWLDEARAGSGDASGCHDDGDGRSSAPGSGRGDVLRALPGGAAAEMQLDACVSAMSRGGRGQSSLEGDVNAHDVATSDGQFFSAITPERAGALTALSAALQALPRHLYRNGLRASALGPHASRWPHVAQTLQTSHAASPSCALGMVYRPPAQAARTGAPALQTLDDAARAGLLEPLWVKVRVLDATLCSLAQILCLDVVVPVKRLSRGDSRGTASRLRRHRYDGFSSEGSDSGDEHE